MDALATVTYAGTKKNLVESNMVSDQPVINGQQVTVVLEFPRDTDPFLKSTVKAAEAAIKYHCGQDVEVTITTEFKSKPRPEGQAESATSGFGGHDNLTTGSWLMLTIGLCHHTVHVDDDSLAALA